jgi:hypothetical protein
MLVESVAAINTRLINDSIDIAEFWRIYLSEIASGNTIDGSTAASLVLAGCSELQLDSTSGAIAKQLAEARTLFHTRFPKLREQLGLRGRPLRDRWDTFGPGCLREIERLVWRNSPPTDWWPPRVTGFLVQPIRGGDGDWDGPGGRFWMEAMLTDADPVVPEVLRVAWLVCCVAIENHCRSRSGETDLMRAWKLASVPIALQAGRAVELVAAESLPINRAMAQWHVASESVAELVSRWWAQWQDSGTALPVALRQLSQQLG